MLVPRGSILDKILPPSDKVSRHARRTLGEASRKAARRECAVAYAS